MKGAAVCAGSALVLVGAALPARCFVSGFDRGEGAAPAGRAECYWK